MARSYASQRVSGFSETVFAKYTRLAQAAGAINLGQGFPDFDPPEFVRAALREAASGYQQYAPLPGLPVLLEALAHKLGPELSADHLQVTVGATEGLFASMQALLDPGDEVVLIEPFYDAYPADVTMAGGVPRYVPLTPLADGRWSLDLDELRAAFTPLTKAIILNTPHNPTGKVFTAAELDAVVALAEEFDAVIIADEVYEHIAFVPHLPVASRPGAWPRTITLSSVGKTFSVTGWKIGWAVGPQPLISALRLAHQWIPFAVATPLQQAAASILQQAEASGYYAELMALYRRKRDLLVAALAGSPLKPLTSEGSYFVMADSSALGLDDVALCDALPGRVGVAAIPPSAFYSEAHKPLAKHLIRLAFCKSDEALCQAGERLKGLAEAFA
ncbi:MAG: aminotransferase class I/II-fold pyridoxal phosphate-dependent enzyme [Truepera sp.]|nr:aminotransferase class I/II-fold pyridoxal phosphate-dependent enzyme [Truepera sp.]